MARYQYQGVDSGGLRTRGEINADSEGIAISELAARGLMVAKISKQVDVTPRMGFMGDKLGLSELQRFTAELALLLRNGVRIDKGLSVLVRNTKKPAERRFLKQVLDDVRGGGALSSSIDGFPDLFSETYLNLVRAGEASGRLDDVFLQLASDLKYRKKLQNQVLQALTYPTVILFVCLLSVGFVFNYIVPQMAPLFAGSATLPGYTQFLLSASDWLRDYQLYLVLAVPIIAFSVGSAFSSRARRDRLLSYLMRWPVVGRLILLVNQIQANSTLSITLASGLTVDRAFGLAANSVQNQELRQSLVSAQERVRRGESLSGALRGNPLYPDFAHSLIEVGEESGDLRPCFDELTDRARTDFELRIAQLTSILEPVLILFMGGIVGGVVVTMLLSVVSVNDIAL